MRCMCGTAFCWLCGKEVDDDTFPKHFQWWNANGCSNMQMDNNVEPTRASIICARISTILQLIVFGPITFITSVIALCLCCCCIKHLWVPPVDTRPNAPPSTCYTRLVEVFSGCLTGWGMVYMFLLVGIPICVLGGPFFLVTFLFLCMAYAIKR